MKFTPLSDEKLNKPLYEDGAYKFVVENAIEKISKSGNEMIEISMRIQDSNKMPINVKDYLLSMDGAIWKLSGFCKAIRREGWYKEGSLEAAKLIGARGEAIFENKSGDDGKKYLKVKGYVFDTTTQHGEPITQVIDEKFNDEIPF